MLFHVFPPLNRTGESRSFFKRRRREDGKDPLEWSGISGKFEEQALGSGVLAECSVTQDSPWGDFSTVTPHPTMRTIQYGMHVRTRTAPAGLVTLNA